MNQAIKMNPQDPWPQYWLAYLWNEEKSNFYINKKEKIEKNFPWDNTEMYFFG